MIQNKMKCCNMKTWKQKSYYGQEEFGFYISYGLKI